MAFPRSSICLLVLGLLLPARPVRKQKPVTVAQLSETWISVVAKSQLEFPIHAGRIQG
jgi:hypothetical protein